MHAICVTVKGERVTCSNTGPSRIRGKEQQDGVYTYDKITNKMSWLFFVKTLQSLCDTERKIVISLNLKTL